MKMYTATIKEDALKLASKNKYYSRQKALFILVVTLVSVIPLMGISFSTFRYYKNSWIEDTSTEMAALADSRREVIDVFLADQDNLLNSLINLYTPEYLSQQDNLEKIFSATNRTGVVTDLGVIDSSGAHLSYVGPFSGQLADKNYAQEEWFTEAMRSGDYTSDIFSGFRGVPHFIIAVANPSRTMILRATVNSDRFNSLLASAEVGPGGDAFIVNRRGEPQTPSRLGISDLPFSLEETVSGAGPSVRQTDEYIYATAGLKNGDWTLVLKQDINSSLAGYNSARSRAVILMALAIGLIATVAAVLGTSMINRIRAADQQRLALNNRMMETEKMALIGRLAASVSHEINNPLQIIESQAGWIDELLKDEQPSKLKNLAEYREAAHKIRTHVGRAKQITHRLLGFSHAGERPSRRVNLNDLIEEAVSFLENEANQNHIVIEKRLKKDLPDVLTHPNQLEQVLLNIVNNAIDAIGQDGTIAISTSVTNGSVVAEFSDTGPGMSEDLRNRIFDPFFTTKKSKGAGLGLSISYNIMQRLGGAIEAGNNESGGSVFTVTLPVDGHRIQSRAKRGEKNE